MDARRIPPGGTNATCPRCKRVFFVAPPPLVTAGPNCPKCGTAHNGAESCPRCGLIFDKYWAAEKRRQQQAAATEPAAEASPATPSGFSEGFRFGYGRGDIFAWAAEGRLAPDDLPAALRLAGTLPAPADWRRFLDGLSLWLGALFLAASAIFFFAYNWRELGHYARFGIVELLLVGALAAAWRLGLERTSGKAALLVATLLVGVLLALISQTYQTGADSWELFALWAACVLPWVAIARFAPLWLLELALLNLAVGLYYRAFAEIFGFFYGHHTLWWTLAGMNSAALALWELAARRGTHWLAERWPPRCVATLAAGFITLLAIWGIVDHQNSLLEYGGYALWIAAVYVVYRRRVRDLYLLALGVLSLIVVVAVFLGHEMLNGGEAASYLFIGMTVIGMSAAGGWWLRAVAREVEA